LRSLRSFAAIESPSYLRAFAVLADVAKGGDGAKSALREFFFFFVSLPNVFSFPSFASVQKSV
jgi:hypothetical protein